MDGIDLSFFVKTKADAKDFSDKIGVILEHIYKTDFTLEKELLTQFGLVKQEKFIAFLRSSNVQIDSIPQVQAFLTSLLQRIATLPTLSICLAFEPTDETLEMLSDWFLLHIKQHLLLDITVNKELIAGMTITYNGKYVDTSIKPQFDAIFPTFWAAPRPVTPPLTPVLPQQNQPHSGQSPPSKPVVNQPITT